MKLFSYEHVEIDHLLGQFSNMSQSYKKCFLSYVDLLGFKKMVQEQEDASDIVSMLESRFNEISMLSGSSRIDSKMRAILISDTFLLYTEDDSLESFQQLIAASAHFVSMSITNCMGSKLEKDSTETLSFARLSTLFRGAISYGDFYADEKTRIFFGKSYNDAHDWEKKLEWIGIMLTPNCSDFVKSKGWQKYKHFLVEYDVPIKKTIYKEDGTHKIERSIKKSLCVNWTKDFLDDLIKINPTFYERAEQKYREKYKNTYDFIIFCEEINKS